MTETELIKILEELINLPAETEIVEFKKATNGFSNDDLCKYFSALSNEANLNHKEFAWLVFGVHDRSHDVLGTNYKPTRPSLDEMKKIVADQTTCRLTFREIYEVIYNGKRVVMFQIPAAPIGIPIAYQGFYYGRDGESLGALNINEMEEIRSQGRRVDWSSQIVPDTTIDDLDPAAIQKARELYTLKNPRHAEQIPTWDDETFLNKAKITIRGKITNAAIVLLGKEESEVLISPSVAKIKWILKDIEGFERDYIIECCPFIFAIDRIYEKIRNLKYRYINPLHKTLFPEEIDTYDPNVIREAIYNAVAHQDYTKEGQINVVEFDDKLVFSNLGGFIPVTIDNVLQSNAPQELYRNKLLVDAMVGLNMVDTIGSGIKNMYKAQRRRLFPLPIYDISADRVEVTIIGKIMDMNYANILAENSSLSLMDIELLNRVQLNRPISDSEVKYLRKSGLIEGRMPNIYISKDVAQKTDRAIEYSKHKGLKDKVCEELILNALRDHKKLTKSEIRELLWEVLPNVLSDNQKESKIKNILSKLRANGYIKSDNRNEWTLMVKS